MNHLVRLFILFFITSIFVSEPVIYAEPIYIPKLKLPTDPRPFPKTEHQWKNIQKMTDPLAKDTPKSTPFFSPLAKGTQSSIPWNELKWGDILLGRGSGKNCVPYGYFRHAGMWHYSKKMILSAMPKEGVCFQSPAIWTKDLPRMEFLTVPKLSLKLKETITKYGERQLGKPYSFSAKGTIKSWYCSKIPWACYHGQGINLDYYGLFLVAPDSLYNSPHAKTFYRKFG